jgi:hypothetical protein
VKDSRLGCSDEAGATSSGVFELTDSLPQYLSSYDAIKRGYTLN